AIFFIELKTFVNNFPIPSIAPEKSPRRRAANTLNISEIALKTPSTIFIITPKLEDQAEIKLSPILSQTAFIKALILLNILDNEAHRFVALTFILSKICAPFPDVK